MITRTQQDRGDGIVVRREQGPVKNRRRWEILDGQMVIEGGFLSKESACVQAGIHKQEKSARERT